MHMAMRARQFCLLFLLLPLLGSAIAQDKPKIDIAALKERIAKLPATSIDLRKAAATGAVKPPPKPQAEAPKSAAATSAAPPASPAPKAAAPTGAFGGVLGASTGKAIGTLSLPKKVWPTAPKTQSSPAVTAAATASVSSVLATAVQGIARYVPLPPEEAQAVQELLAAQMQAQTPAGAPRAFESFRGAVMIPALDASEVTLVPIVLVDDPLRFERDRHVFEGRIAVGLVELDPSGKAKKLSAPIGFQVFGDASADPELAQVDSTSPPFTSIKIASRDPRDAIELRVVSNVSAEPVSVRLPVERARLVLRGKTLLQGWGLESTEVTVSASDGERSRGEVVVLSAPRGNLTPETVKLGDEGTAQAALRSESTGPVLLEATSMRLQPATLEFSFEFPYRFLLAGLIGGLAGGLLRRGLKRRGSTRRLALELLLGVITGALVFGLFVLGVNLVGFQLPRDGGEVLVAVVAALGAYFGTQLVKPPAAPA
jgi:hypothetical protein